MVPGTAKKKHKKEKHQAINPKAPTKEDCQISPPTWAHRKEGERQHAKTLKSKCQAEQHQHTYKCTHLLVYIYAHKYVSHLRTHTQAHIYIYHMYIHINNLYIYTHILVFRQLKLTCRGMFHCTFSKNWLISLQRSLIMDVSHGWSKNSHGHCPRRYPSLNFRPKFMFGIDVIG